VLAALARRVRSDGLSAAGLASWLLGQRDAIASALPAGLGPLLGEGARPAASAAREPVRAASPGGSRWLWPLLLLLGAGVLWMLLRGREERLASAPQPEVVEEAEEVPAPVAAAPPSGADLLRRTLPNGVVLSAPRGGLEDQLVLFIDDPEQPLDERTWFNFDRLLFETGSAVLKPESREQLRNVAAILVAYPGVKVKIGGYTDNTGDPAANLALSQARATHVMNELVGLGVAADRLEAEGYGDQYPVADNTTEAGRAQNRRIALRVTDR
jgi:outer membrane protein OmpA-like peptidoglycan-associated protein